MFTYFMKYIFRNIDKILGFYQKSVLIKLDKTHLLRLNEEIHILCYHHSLKKCSYSKDSIHITKISLTQIKTNQKIYFSILNALQKHILTSL